MAQETSAAVTGLRAPAGAGSGKPKKPPHPMVPAIMTACSIARTACRAQGRASFTSKWSGSPAPIQSPSMALLPRTTGDGVGPSSWAAKEPYRGIARSQGECPARAGEGVVLCASVISRASFAQSTFPVWLACARDSSFFTVPLYFSTSPWDREEDVLNTVRTLKACITFNASGSPNSSLPESHRNSCRVVRHEPQ